jgi:transposase
MSQRARFVGLDVHMATIAVAVADEGGDVEGANDPGAVRKMVQRLSAGDAHLKAACEAGPTGYDLYR